MLFKLFLLVTVCSTLVLSRNVNRRDLNSVRIEDHHSSVEIRKQNKRNDEIAKKLTADEINQPPMAFEASEEKTHKDNIRMMNQAVNKRFALDRQLESTCCG